jgi:transposase
MGPIITKVDQRLETFNKVQELQASGVAIRRISIDLKMSRNTVKSYFVQEKLAARTHAKSTNFDLFTGHIVSRLRTDGYKLKDIYEEIREMGFNGGRSTASYNINILKEEYNISTPGFTQVQHPKIPYIKPLSSRKLACYIGVSLTDIGEPNERYYLQTLLNNITELRIVTKLVQIFKTMIARGKGNIRRWIDFVMRSKRKLAGLKSFARGLLRDISAVENGINMPWSNGAVEGHVNRIKSIKRQMYGRASFELLRKKVILSQTG